MSSTLSRTADSFAKRLASHWKLLPWRLEGNSLSNCRTFSPWIKFYLTLQTRVVDITVDANAPLDYVVELDRICQEVTDAVNDNIQFIILSDKRAGPDRYKCCVCRNCYVSLLTSDRLSLQDTDEHHLDSRGCPSPFNWRKTSHESGPHPRNGRS